MEICLFRHCLIRTSHFLLISQCLCSLVAFLLATIFFTVPCYASTVVLQWDPNPEMDLAGYRVYYKVDACILPFDGIGSAEGASPVDVYALTTATISGLDADRTYCFAVTAYNTAGQESSFSNIVAVPGPRLPGDITGDGVLDTQDALLALKFAAGILNPAPDELLRGDVAPIINGQSMPNGIIDTGDAIVILSLIMGKIVL